MTDGSVFASLAAIYGQLSLLAFGGANSIIPEMQRQVVEVHGWLGAQEFAALFALAQAAPGPNMMVVSLIGWRVAGLAGALTATVAVAAPSSILTLLVSGAWERFRNRPWRKAIQNGLVPVTAGLLMASAFLLIVSTVTDWRSALLAVACFVLFLRVRLHPMLVLAASALSGAIGFTG